VQRDVETNRRSKHPLAAKREERHPIQGQHRLGPLSRVSDCGGPLCLKGEGLNSRRLGTHAWFEPMKSKHNLISVRRALGFHVDPNLTNQESIVLRALASGRTDRQVCNDLGVEATAFISMMREMREKIGTSDNISLIAWAKLQIKDGERRIDKPEGYGRLA
jgi:DNA-binding CsgD family transcriptional regulator